MNVARLLRARALEAPERPAIIERAGAISFAEFDAASAAAAAMLAARGVLPGARVLLLSPMSIDLYVAIVGDIQSRRDGRVRGPVRRKCAPDVLPCARSP